MRIAQNLVFNQALSGSSKFSTKKLKRFVLFDADNAIPQSKTALIVERKELLNNMQSMLLGCYRNQTCFSYAFKTDLATRIFVEGRCTLAAFWAAGKSTYLQEAWRNGFRTIGPVEPSASSTDLERGRIASMKQSRKSQPRMTGAARELHTMKSNFTTEMRNLSNRRIIPRVQSGFLLTSSKSTHGFTTTHHQIKMPNTGAEKYACTQRSNELQIPRVIITHWVVVSMVSFMTRIGWSYPANGVPS